MEEQFTGLFLVVSLSYVSLVILTHIQLAKCKVEKETVAKHFAILTHVNFFIS